MPKDLYIFLTIIVALVVLQLLNLPRGWFLLMFSLVVIGQVAFLVHGFTQQRRRRRRN